MAVKSELRAILGRLRDEETLDWYSLTPQERLAESIKLRDVFVSLGGRYDPEPDSQSPFCIFEKCDRKQSP